MTRVLRSPAAIFSEIRGESGAASIWAIAWMFIFMLLGGVAVDVSNAYAMKSRLQSVADASALAAVMQIDDRVAARAAAVLLAARNMPDDAKGRVITTADVRFGLWDADTGAFVEVADDEPAEAVRIVARRNLRRGNAVPTYLVRLVGHDEWELGAASTATTSGRAPVPTDGPGADCTGATILSTGSIDTDGDSDLAAGTCLYGEDGVETGDEDCFETGAHVISPDAANVTINPLRCGEEDDIVVEDTLDPKLLPKIHDGYFDATFYAVNNAGKKWGDDETPEQLALLPARFAGAQIMRVSMGWWIVEDVHLSENYIYLVDHGVQFAGGVDAKNVAFIVNGQIGVGSGDGLKFDNVFFFGKGQLNFSGDVMWGSESAYCEDGEYRVYLFSEASLLLGGSGPDTSAYGVMGAAPQFDPGGAFKNAGGLYIETEGETSLGGDMHLTGCEAPLASMFDEPANGVLAGGIITGIDGLINGGISGDPAAVQAAAGTVLGASLVQ